MYYARNLSGLGLLLTLLLVLPGCDGLGDDLSPSGADRRAEVVAGSIGAQPSQQAADFRLTTSTGSDFTLSAHLQGGSDPADVIVLYFTMWCPVCLAHSDYLYSQIIPRFRNRGRVVYALVDYVSGSVSGSRMQELANGYAGSDFVTLADVDQALQHQLNATMATVVVIDRTGTILLNEDFRDGSALTASLEQQLP
ncbi:MAG: redoxin family protein [Gammaproteobacteria bacterium]|nr:redoxin family protein [Gammaproteobacteria bacterium]